MDPENPSQPGQPPTEKPSEPAAQPAQDTAPTPEAPLATSEAGGTSTVPEPGKPHPGPFKRLRHFLFKPETNLGWNVFNVLRAFLYGLLMFAFGMLFYFILVRPEIDELNITRTDLKSNRQQISSLQATLTTEKKQLAGLQATYQKSQIDLQKAQLRSGVLELLNQVNVASLAVINKDGPTAQSALTDARASLNGLLPILKVVDPGVADQLDTRLTQVTSELVDNPTAVQSDLGQLETMLDNFDKVMTGSQ